MTTLAPAALDAAIGGAYTELAAAAPELVDGFRAALPSALQTAAKRLVGAAYREGLAGLRDPAALAAVATGVTRHAFDRIEIGTVPDPHRALTEIPARLGSGPHDGLALELADNAVKLALAYARRGTPGVGLLDAAAGLGPDDQAVYLEGRSTDGHNLHPCGRTRLGWSIADALAHDLESPGTSVGFVAIRRELHTGDDLGALLDVPAPRPGYVVQPVHAWQLGLVRRRYAGLIGDGALVPLDVTLPALPTVALRTVLLGARPGTPRRYLKLSLDIQVTSTRRTISVASTRNGPVVSVLLHRLLAEEPRVLLMDEEAGAAGCAGGGRDLSAIVRRGLDGRLAPGETAVPGSALYARSVHGTVLHELVDRYARTRRIADRRAAAGSFLDEYARLLLPPVLRLATRYGVAVEAHLQNCVPTFRDGVPHRLAMRDFAGMRLHLPRLAARGYRAELWPGSVTATGDLAVMRGKLAYTAFQANLGELVTGLAGGYGLAEDAAWATVRAVVDEVYDDLRADPAITADAAADHEFLTAALVPHKALLLMRVHAGGDRYLPVHNPLHRR